MFYFSLLQIFLFYFLYFSTFALEPNYRFTASYSNNLLTQGDVGRPLLFTFSQDQFNQFNTTALYETLASQNYLFRNITAQCLINSNCRFENILIPYEEYGSNRVRPSNFLPNFVPLATQNSYDFCSIWTPISNSSQWWVDSDSSRQWSGLNYDINSAITNTLIQNGYNLLQSVSENLNRDLLVHSFIWEVSCYDYFCNTNASAVSANEMTISQYRNNINGSLLHELKAFYCQKCASVPLEHQAMQATCPYSFRLVNTNRKMVFVDSNGYRACLGGLCFCGNYNQFVWNGNPCNDNTFITSVNNWFASLFFQFVFMGCSVIVLSIELFFGTIPSVAYLLIRRDVDWKRKFRKLASLRVSARVCLVVALTLNLFDTFFRSGTNFKRYLFQDDFLKFLQAVTRWGRFFLLYYSFYMIIGLWATIVIRGACLQKKSIWTILVRVILGIVFFLLILPPFLVVVILQSVSTLSSSVVQYYSIVAAVFLAISVVIIGVGLSVFGIIIFVNLKRGNKNASFVKFKFTKFMVFTVILVFIAFFIQLFTFIFPFAAQLSGNNDVLVVLTYVNFSNIYIFLVLCLCFSYLLFDSKPYQVLWKLDCTQKLVSALKPKKKDKAVALFTPVETPVQKQLSIPYFSREEEGSAVSEVKSPVRKNTEIYSDIEEKVVLDRLDSLEQQYSSTLADSRK